MHTNDAEIITGRSPHDTPTEKDIACSTEDQWHDFFRDGYLHLGRVLTASEVELLCRRADDLALGRITNPNVQMQLDTGGIYEDLPAPSASSNWLRPRYRKIQGLEADEHFSRCFATQSFARSAVDSSARAARSRPSGPW